MSGAFGDFNAANVKPLGDRSPVPAGIYQVVCMDANWKDNKAGTGRYLELQFEILAGEHKGRSVWSRLNLTNPSEKAVQIAHAELSSICRAIDVPTPQAETDLINRPLQISVAVRDDIYNDIQNYAAPGAVMAPPREVKSKPRANAPMPIDDDGLPF
jgi:hypothetical protein